MFFSYKAYEYQIPWPFGFLRNCALLGMLYIRKTGNFVTLYVLGAKTIALHIVILMETLLVFKMIHLDHLSSLRFKLKETSHQGVPLIFL